MASSRVRPSLSELADWDSPAFPELEEGAPPSARVVRGRPPAIASTMLPPPVPVVSPSPAAAAAPPAPAKPKSRFALQREREAAQRAAEQASADARAERFELDLDGEASGADERGGGALPRGSSRPSLVKGVVERTPSSSVAPPRPPTAPGPPRPSPLGASATGFPASSRGLFPRKTAPPPAPRSADPVPSASDEPDSDTEGDPYALDSLMASVSRENDDVLRGMSEAQILEEQRQIREELGLSEDVLRMLQARGQKRTGDKAAKRAPTPRTRPAPQGAPAPKPAAPTQEDGEEDEEGSPEYIRKHFFPDEPHNPALDWMRPPPKQADPSAAAALPTAARLSFDIFGRRTTGDALPAGAVVDAGAEHHVSSSTTFTVPSLLSLTASSVPSQRSTAFTVLQRILAQSSALASQFGAAEWQSLRIKCAQRAAFALRDPNLGVVGACITLLSDVLAGELAAAPAQPKIQLEGAEEPETVVSAFLAATRLPSLASHLSLGALPPASLRSILALLTSLAHLSRAGPAAAETLDALFSTPRLLDSLVQTFIGTQWPPTPSSPAPEPAALSFLALLARTSRSRASQLYSRALVDPTLRFLAVPPWELLPAASTSDRTLGYALLRETLELWTTLGRYGLATDLRTKAAPLLDALIERVGELRREPEGRSAEETSWVAPLLRLLSIWTVAAIDPHVTEHDVTWSQVDEWRDVALEAYALGCAGTDGRESASEMVAAAWELLGSWMEGSKVNKSWRGEDERKWLKEQLGGDFDAGGRARRLVEQALEDVARGDGSASAARTAAAALRLSGAYAEPTEPPTPQLLDVDPGLADRVLQAIVSGHPDPAATAVASYLLPALDSDVRLTRTIELLPRLGVQDAVLARDLVDRVFAAAAGPQLRPSADDLDRRLERPALAQAAILRPFVTHAIVSASQGRVVGPLYPTSRDVKLTHCLPPFSPDGPVLSPDWPLSALDELLRSATSPVFQQLPAGWDASELQVVRTSLALMRFVRAAGSKAILDAPTLVYDLIKVFMLEKDNAGTTTGTSGADAEVFRDAACQHSMNALLSELAISEQGQQVVKADERPSSATIEGVSSIVSSAPFYQLYTDLVGLYDSISLSDRLFGLVLLPPLSMAYPVDFRRLLWTDYAHLLPTLRFTVEDAISDVRGDGALAAYLEPRETKEPMLAAYVDALAGGRVRADTTPFLHLVALHHVASAIRAAQDGGDQGKVAERIVSALVNRGARETLQQLVQYSQNREGEALEVPPACFEAGKAEQHERRQALEKLAGGTLAQKLEALLS
ncbi:uncharacterized protein JCM10292_007707 [Rhodotorula paludigena]|uniref:uncharacterized protein n=1 Tax=Rhodotorula paludigena TaxID=86838 RepID=UPI00317EE1F2